MMTNGDKRHNTASRYTGAPRGHRDQRAARRRNRAAAATEAAETPMMTAPTARLGTTPTMREDLDRALALIAAMAERIAILESRSDVDDQIDGPAPAPLPATWVPLKQAAEISGYSASALRKLREPRWWRYDGGRVLVDTKTCPRKLEVRTRT
jgi:hypothetical protein